MTINNCSQTSQWQQRRKTIFIFNPYKHENITMIFLIVRALRVSNLWCCLVANLKGLAMSKYYPINPAVPEKKPNAPKQCPWTSLNERNNAGGTLRTWKQSQRKQLYQDELLAAALEGFLRWGMQEWFRIWIDGNTSHSCLHGLSIILVPMLLVRNSSFSNRVVIRRRQRWLQKTRACIDPWM